MNNLDSVKCQCGLVYLAGSGTKDDPFMSAAYDPIKGELDDCKVCRIDTGVYTHVVKKGLYTVIATAINKTTDTTVVIYVKNVGAHSNSGMFVRSIEDFREKFKRVGE